MPTGSLSPSPGPSVDPTPTRPTAWWSPASAVVPLLTLAVAVGYLGVDLSGVDEPVPGPGTPLVHAGLVVLQALALTQRHRRPVVVLAAVAALDLAVLLTSGGQLGLGSFAVVVAAYTAARHVPGPGQAPDGRDGRRRALHLVLVAAAGATAVLGAGAMLLAGSRLLDVLLVSAGRVALTYVVPAVVGEQVRARERLAQVLRERAELLERERHDRAERELQAGRTALARELHDIAGHHLSGIVVSAQAASALTATDPDRAREMLRLLQDDARTALADLRRTVGLLRSEPDGPGDGRPSRVPSLDAVPALVADARSRGQQVEHVQEGRPRALSPLAGTAAYRLVQESLANSARHAPGAACEVRVAYLPDVVRVSVANAPPPGRTVPDDAVPDDAVRDRQEGRDRHEGYGLAGMAERAALVGARLVTGPRPDGGWCNELTIPAPAPTTAPTAAPTALPAAGGDA